MWGRVFETHHQRLTTAKQHHSLIVRFVLGSDRESPPGYLTPTAIIWLIFGNVRVVDEPCGAWWFCLYMDVIQQNVCGQPRRACGLFLGQYADERITQMGSYIHMREAMMGSEIGSVYGGGLVYGV